MPSRGCDAVVEAIRASVASVTSSSSYAEWLRGEIRVADNDVVAINNSFVYRDGVTTTKSTTYLCIHHGELHVCRPPSFNADYKRFLERSGNLPPVLPLSEVTESHLHQLGRLLFILIGFLDESIGARVSIDHSLFDSLVFNPGAVERVGLEGSAITVNSLTDPEQVWLAAEQLARSTGVITESLPTDLEAPFAAAFERLQTEAFSMLRLPEAEEVPDGDTLLGRIAVSLSEQLAGYEEALVQCAGEPHHNRQAFSELLRIAYNFAGDATSLIQLLVSVCDLKPVLMWCTLPQHLELAEAFRQLPWIKSKKKASLSLYRDTIAGARNHAFHDLFAFDRSVEVDVQGISLAARRLQLFPPYSGRRSSKGFEYEDQELVDLLSGFTRAPELTVSPTFWKRNATVMQALEALLKATITSLQLFRVSLDQSYRM